MVPPHCVEQCADEIKRTANLNNTSASTPAGVGPHLSPVERLPPPGNIDRPEREPTADLPAELSSKPTTVTNRPENTPTPRTATSTPISTSAAESAAQAQAQQQAAQLQQSQSLAQQMSDMQGVLNAMGLASQLQQQFNPMMMGLSG